MMLYECQIQNNVKRVSKMDAILKSEGIDPLYTYSCLKEEKRQKKDRKSKGLFAKLMGRVKLSERLNSRY